MTRQTSRDKGAGSEVSLVSRDRARSTRAFGSSPLDVLERLLVDLEYLTGRENLALNLRDFEELGGIQEKKAVLMDAFLRHWTRGGAHFEMRQMFASRLHSLMDAVRRNAALTDEILNELTGSVRASTTAFHRLKLLGNHYSAAQKDRANRILASG